MKKHDVRQSAKLDFREDLNFILMPKVIPSANWATLQDWIVDAIRLSYYNGRGKFDDSRPSNEWFRRSYRLIEATWNALNSPGAHYQFLLFPNLEIPPVYLRVDAYLGDVPWKKAMKIYTHAAPDEVVVDSPRVEPFDYPGAETAARIVHFIEVDPSDHTLATRYSYPIRKDGMDILVRAFIPNLAYVQDGVPVLEEFVRGIVLSFRDKA
ncbi:hypothetical protein KGQ19_10850 [Catenulispora sp. NL8]|uniref:Uncharacterized protein n=2 Tax=Catenulispora pinistramenti TaxID=2705254 RepID=A0ABS5KMW1_9ACTN|nr:hypothetical protein [Catenulispora pinistramenti]MBS2547373.1 hypothetical protein [Catenulispora pinistramenti]